MGKYEGSVIELVNWEKYNPRLDSKRPSWFRLEASFATGQEYFNLSPNQKWGWVVLMGSACERNGAPFTLSYKWLQMFSNLTDAEIDELIDYFIKKDALRVSRASNVRESRDTRNNLPATDGRTDETDETDETDGGAVSENSETLACVIFDPDLNEIFAEKLVLDRHWKAWSKAFPDEKWVAQEIKHAYAWEQSAPANKKKRFSTFVTRWLGRGWDTRSRSQSPPKIKTRQDQISENNLALLSELGVNLESST